EVQHGRVRRRVLFERLPRLEGEGQQLHVVVRVEGAPLNVLGGVPLLRQLGDTFGEVGDVSVVHTGEGRGPRCEGAVTGALDKRSLPAERERGPRRPAHTPPAHRPPRPQRRGGTRTGGGLCYRRSSTSPRLQVLMSREAARATTWGLVVTVALAALIVVGSRNLEHFDAALVGYTFAVLFATFGLTYRYTMWLQRPPTGVYWRRGWEAFFKRGWRLRNLGTWVRRVGSEVLANRFILRRSRLRGVTHLLIMWGCLLAVAITFPLVFGWLHFRPVPGDLDLYEAVVFGFPAFRFPHESALAF